MGHAAEWMGKGTFGLMTHYLITPQGNTAEEKTKDFNKTIWGFDLEKYCDQFSRTGADWLIFTIGQNTGYYASPNEYLDRELPGRTSERDLVLTLAERVKCAGKRFIAYLPAEVGMEFENMPELKNVFKWKPGDQAEFQKRYQEFVRAYAKKFSHLLDGWWFDGCYEYAANLGIKFDWHSWIETAKAGNPDAIVAFNDGAFCIGNTEAVTPLADYLAGEVHYLENGKIKLRNITIDIPGMKEGLYMPSEQYVKGVQWHALLPFDSTFIGGQPLSYDDKTLFEFVRDCRKVGGAVTINIPVSDDGRMLDKSVAQLQRLCQNL